RPPPLEHHPGVERGRRGCPSGDRDGTPISRSTGQREPARRGRVRHSRADGRGDPADREDAAGAGVIDLAGLLASITAPSRDGESAARSHLDSLTKPPGSLGRLEELAVRLAILSGRSPSVARPVIFTFAADHGVVAEGVSAYPQVVTAQMVENFTRG